MALFQVRNQWGEMVPLGTLMRLREINGPVSVTRYNLYTSAAVTGIVRPGVSSGDAIAAVERVVGGNAAALHDHRVDRTDVPADPRGKHGDVRLLRLAVVFVFLALAALYESWALPLAVILVVPMCLLCSIGGVLISGRGVDIFVQIGLVVLVGLACKNAILIVEFAESLHRSGKPRDEATLEASRLRIRPILMTSLAFILGVVPPACVVMAQRARAPDAGDGGDGVGVAEVAGEPESVFERAQQAVVVVLLGVGAWGGEWADDRAGDVPAGAEPVLGRARPRARPRRKSR